MAKEKKYRLKGRGRVGRNDEDGDFHIVVPGDELTKKELEALPKHQQKMFEEVPEQTADVKSEKAKDEPLKSGDLHAKEAIAHIEASKSEDLKGFLSPDEDRSTVLEAWDDKFEEPGKKESDTSDKASENKN